MRTSTGDRLGESWPRLLERDQLMRGAFSQRVAPEPVALGGVVSAHAQ